MKKTFKRIFDFSFSFFGLIILIPMVFIPVAILIKITSKGPVFFTQKRIGKDKKFFYLIKFRTMRYDTPKNVPTHLFKNPEKWILPIGRFLRKSSIDELPQLFNILKGDMSVVGPRPALWNQDDLISERDKYGVNQLKPGLTGWAQINGRDTLTIEEKVKLDHIYLLKNSPLFDFIIIIKSLKKFFKDENIVEGVTKRK
jgi:O-antigen biosynthesis protein WbqP